MEALVVAASARLHRLPTIERDSHFIPRYDGTLQLGMQVGHDAGHRLQMI